MFDEEDFEILDFGFCSISFKNVFPKFELLNSGCSLSAGAAYLQVFMVFISYRKCLEVHAAMKFTKFCF